METNGTIQMLKETTECNLCENRPKYIIDSCSVNRILMLVGSKWVLPIILEVKLRKKIRFNELQKLLAPISAKILSKRLKTLQDKDFIRKEITSMMPVPRTLYLLTKKGEQLIECLIPLLNLEKKTITLAVKLKGTSKKTCYSISQRNKKSSKK